MDRLSEIRARCEGAKEEKRKGNALDCACLSWAVVLNDVPYLLEQLTLSKAREHPQNLFLELTPQQRAENAEIVALTARAEKAEAERDTYMEALQNFVSVEEMKKMWREW